jgi:protein cornichon
MLLYDLESGLVNPITMCRSVNRYVEPEIGSHLVLAVTFLITGHYVEFLLNLPLVIWNINR